MSKRGLLIDIEAIDGGGGETQKNKLRDYLKSEKMNPSVYDYPRYDRPTGKIIRDFLDKKIDLSIDQQFYLYATDMAMDNLEIEGALSKGYPVVRNRGPNSTAAYQCSGGFSYEDAVDFLKMSQNIPDVVFYMDVDTAEAQKRKAGDNEKLDKFEANTGYMDKVRSMYGKLVDDGKLGKRYEKIDGSESINEVHDEIKNRLKKLL